MDNIDLDILTFIRERENYEAYKDSITKNLCTKESWLLVGDIGRYYDDNPTATALSEDFKLWFRVTGHPGWKSEEHDIYATIIDNVLVRPTPDRSTFLSQLERTRFITSVSGAYDKLRDGHASPDDFGSRVAEFRDILLRRSRTQSVQEYDIEDIAKDMRSNAGLFWRLEDLNRSIGPIRKGDFIVVAKRPEVGGTSFLCSEMSYMIEQLPPNSNSIIFHNEEAPRKVYSRMMSSALTVDYKTIMLNPALHKAHYHRWLQGRTWELNHDTSMTLASLHRKLRERQYDLIGINVLLKVGGTNAKEDHDKFQALGEECRRIAELHAPIIAVVQADPSAEGLRFIPQDRIYKCKTALQAEADALIMIGQDHDMPSDIRYINVAKNKIPPAPCTDLAYKHIKSECGFDIGTGHFTSRNFTGNSRGVAGTHLPRSVGEDNS